MYRGTHFTVVAIAVALFLPGPARSESLATAVIATGGCRSFDSMWTLVQAAFRKDLKTQKKLVRSDECFAIPTDTLAIVLDDTAPSPGDLDGAVFIWKVVAPVEGKARELYVVAADWRPKAPEPEVRRYVPPGNLEGLLVTFERTMLICRDWSSLREARMFEHSGDTASHAVLLASNRCAYLPKEQSPLAGTITSQTDDLVEVSIRGDKIWARAIDLTF